MTRSAAFLLATLAVATSCASKREPSAGANGARALFAAHPEPESRPATAPRPSPETEEFFADPAFRRRFVESYLAESEVEPKVSLPEREKLQRVLELIAAEKLEEAAGSLAAMRGPAAGAVVDFMYANIRFQQERLDEAAAAYAMATQKFPKFRRAWKNLGVIRVRQGAWADATQPLTRVIELGGGDAVTYGLLGYAFSNQENHLSAESAYRMATLIDPATPDWKMGLARSLFKQKRFADAAALCGSLIESDPARADLWLLQANAYIGLGHPMKAAENYELVDRLGKSTAESLSMLGDIYVNHELFDLAANAYLKALTTFPNASPDRALRAAKAMTARGALKEAKVLAEGVEERRGPSLSTADRRDLLKVRARIAVASGADAEEVKVLEEIVSLDPLDGEALILLGQQKARAGELEKAIFHYERAASLEAFEADAKVRHAQLLVSKNRYAEALPLLRRAQALKPRDNVQEYLEQVERAAAQAR
ncbi:MAG TPA: tetratricopeptide repeat protein [Planctomycetota bacterium]|nr:tetratricopeptide repeat protein [Planctomycetota bacterium]